MSLSRPLPAGAPIGLWRLSALHEARYDTADQPMDGAMDPFFFVTRHKNFIPHEYPCRTQFAAERRGRRPQPVGEPAFTRLSLPFGSPRLDLSGFWFRPTVVGCWAETVIEAQSAGEARLRLHTCGGAVLWVNGEDAGWMAPYGRNLEAAEDFTVRLVAGANTLRLWFDDLAERDARYYVQLDYLDGPPARQALPVPGDPAIAAAMEATLAALRFERPAYRGGTVALVTDAPPPLDLAVRVAVEGDFMSIDAPLQLDLTWPAGETRLALAEAEALPADFRHFHVTLEQGGTALTRVLGVEICHADRQGEAPAGARQRIDEALAHVAAHAEPDTVRALARLSIGQGGPDTEAMIAGALPAIEDCHDCADFILVPLLWSRACYAEDLSPALVERIDAAILGYRYWMDEPGNDVQWYFSENHALLFHTAAYLAGHLLPEARFARSGRSGAEQSATGRERVRRWLDHFESWEMAEFNSAPYFPIDLKGLCALFALAPDEDIASRAGKGILRLLEIVARSAHHGILTGAQGRSYEHTLRAARSLELSGIARMVWGTGFYGARVHALPQLALCLRDHGLIVPDALAAIAEWEGEDGQEWCFAQGDNRFARLAHFKTADYAMGSAAGYRWDEWGYQETVLHLRMGHDADAQVWINHPGELVLSGYGRPSYWGGSGILPRAHQYRDVAVLRFRAKPEQVGFSHAWFPTRAFDEVRFEGDTALARAGDAFLMLRGDKPFAMVADGPTAGCELRLPGHAGTWLVRLGRRAEHGSLDDFAARFAGLRVTEEADDGLLVDDPDHGPIRLAGDGSATCGDERLDPADWTVQGHARRIPKRVPA